ncbi:hypothetical protein [Virgibacillus sp. Bac332]|uniref:hypothetical protein n=1 Tax=Virgibacillus sp. Bac332 TaxID=2419842 RepID=UPI000EF442C2|nr:hypothetical protein [Virgibacillus sp. Bac332]
MKRKIIASSLALSLLLGGAAFSSSSVGAAPITEKEITVKNVQNDNTAEPMFWAAVGKAAAKGVAWGAGWVAGEKGANAILGNSVENNTSYNYQEVKESFDL